MADTLGSQFVAHPAVQPYRVESSPDVPVELAWLVEGVKPFETDDELHLSEYHARERLVPLLETSWQATRPVSSSTTGRRPTRATS